MLSVETSYPEPFSNFSGVPAVSHQDPAVIPSFPSPNIEVDSNPLRNVHNTIIRATGETILQNSPSAKELGKVDHAPFQAPDSVPYRTNGVTTDHHDPIWDDFCADGSLANFNLGSSIPLGDPAVVNDQGILQRWDPNFETFNGFTGSNGGIEEEQHVKRMEIGHGEDEFDGNDDVGGGDDVGGNDDYDDDDDEYDPNVVGKVRRSKRNRRKVTRDREKSQSPVRTTRKKRSKKKKKSVQRPVSRRKRKNLDSVVVPPPVTKKTNLPIIDDQVRPLFRRFRIRH